MRDRGRLAELDVLYGEATLAIVPLRAGGGSRLKILEAFAHGVPVVATSAAARGIDVAHGRELLLAESDEQLAEATVHLATHPDEAVALAERAFAFVCANHDLGTSAAVVARIASGDS